MSIFPIKKTSRFKYFLYLIIVISGFYSFSKKKEDKDSVRLSERVEAYISLMVKKGRDTYGRKHSPLFASSLDRDSFHIMPRNMLPKMEGVREQDRVPGGSNLLQDDKLFSLLFSMSIHKENTFWKHEVEKSFRYFLDHCQSQHTGLFAWGEHLYWDFQTDTVGFLKNHEFHEADNWSHWDLFMSLNKEAVIKFGLGEWHHQVADHTDGNFSRHAKWSTHKPGKNSDFPRYAGQMIYRWALIYKLMAQREHGQTNELELAMKTILRRMEDNVSSTNGKILPAFRNATYGWHDSNLEMAIALQNAANTLRNTDITEKDLLRRMDSLAYLQDKNFIQAQSKQSDSGYLLTVDVHSLNGITRAMNKPTSLDWETGYGIHSHAAIANLCGRRYIQIKTLHPHIAEKYLGLIKKTADFYAKNTPPNDRCLKPDLFADIIHLFLFNYEVTEDKRYIQHAEKYAEIAVCLFLNDGIPLPRATSCHSHYESLTGAPDLMYSFWLLDKKIGHD